MFLENTLGECRINILIKKEEREQRLERRENGHHNPAVGKLSIRQVKICNFSRRGRNTEEEEHLKVQKMTARRAYMVTALWTGWDRFGQVRTGVKYYFSSTVSRTLSKFGLPPKPACSFLTVPRSKLYDPPKWWKQHITLQLA